jgi:hypothetical protein
MMPSLDRYRFDEVRMQTSQTEWATMTPAQFATMPLAERIQLLVARKLRFFSAGTELSAVDALKDLK